MDKPSLSSSSVEAIRYVVIKLLAGKKYVVDAVYRYLVEGKGPSELASEYNVTKHRIRGNIVRFIEKSGGERKARAMAKLLAETSIEVSPIVKDGVCTICGERIQEDNVDRHIATKHKHEVQYLTNKTKMAIIRVKKEKEREAMNS
ncbi:hypothetical protein [Sulfuracidifex metallicus]|uniref:hypothetical protein n=1 Tax=Sulfuracidifex metallicus TaxID=47303 RepID=UPI0022769038|nr:hypothetical protein [Sulfuracidifex metallicus]MCY0850116.1 hypothetical protein [Sulfuracidifex metallicus]